MHTLERGHANLVPVWNGQNQFGKVRAPLKHCRRKKEKAGKAVSPAPWPDRGQDPLLSRALPPWTEIPCPVLEGWLLFAVCPLCSSRRPFPRASSRRGRGAGCLPYLGSLPFWAASYLRSSGQEFWACLCQPSCAGLCLALTVAVL